jgi:hypothetical protein
LIKNISIANNILKNPESFVKNGIDVNSNKDNIEEAESLIKLISSNGEYITIEDFINTMTCDSIDY